jgi:hypothetical protein
MVFDNGARRLETSTVAIGPNVYYLGREQDVDLMFAGFAPHPPRSAASREFWSRIMIPLVLTGVGASFLGHAIAFFHQLATGEKEAD